MAAPTKSRVLRMVPLLLAICLYSAPAQAQYSGGSGTADDPYQIATAEDLMLLGETPEDYNKNFILTADIDLDPNLPGRKEFERAVIAPDTNSTENWYQGTSFSGTFDGNGHTISHLSITGKDFLGLFGMLDLSARIMNLGLVDVNVNSSGRIVGGLIGYNLGDVTECYSAGRIVGHEDVGGLVGDNSWRGLRGGGNIVKSYSICTVSGEIITGGLVGWNLGMINTSYSIVAVKGTGQVGGLVGSNSGDLLQSCSFGIVTGNSNVGGLVGIRWGGSMTCYSTCNVNGIKSVGGLVGHNTGGGGIYVPMSVGQCYSIGEVGGNEQVGGLVGSKDFDNIRASFWDLDTSGQIISAGGTGRSTAEMQTASTFLDAGWDFVDETANGTDDIWWIVEGQSYPRFAWEIGQARPFYSTPSSTRPLLHWSPGGLGLLHDVYFGTHKETVAAATLDSQNVYYGRQAAYLTTYDPGNLQWGTTYYWRIDEVDKDGPNSILKGPVWSFHITDAITSPFPPNGASDISREPTLGWVPGGPGLEYDVYFGQDELALVNATLADVAIYLGRQPAEMTTCELSGLKLGETYYWRVDAVDETDANSPWKGEVRRFTTQLIMSS